LLSKFKKFNCQAQRSVLQRLDKAYARFFKFRKRFPSFKSKTRKIRSFETYQYGKPNKIGRRTYLKISGLSRFSFKSSMPEGVKFVILVKTAIRVKIQFIREMPDKKKENYIFNYPY